MGEKRVLGRVLAHPASEFRRAPGFWMSFHSVVILRVFDYAPPDTGVPNLQLVALEYLLKIEGADRICWSAPFCGEVFYPFAHPKAFPYEGKVARRSRDG